MLIFWIWFFMDRHIQKLSKPGETAGDSMGKTGCVIGEFRLGDPLPGVELDTARFERDIR